MRFVPSLHGVGVCASIGRFGDCYFIPWAAWRDMKEKFGHKYVTREGLFEQLHGGRGRLRRIGFLQQLVGLVDDAVLRQR